MVSIDAPGCRLRNSGAQTSRPAWYITSGFSGRWPIGWLNTPATTRAGARSISFSANETPMQVPKKKNWRVPRVVPPTGTSACGAPLNQLQRKRAADAVSEEEELADAEVIHQPQLVVG